jgi:hypothetical protein
MLTQSMLQSYLNYDPETGIFNWNIHKNSRATYGSVAGTMNIYGYIQICVDSKSYKAHRLAWLYMTGKMPKEYIDHINGDKTDNRFLNLRECSNSQNMQNKKKAQKNHVSGFLGVQLRKDRGSYVSHIYVNKKRKYLGSFKSPELASEAYLKAKRNLHEYGTI